MAIQLEVINFIVPRDVIEKKYPGGWKRCLSDHRGQIGSRIWYDDHLFRTGAMNSMDIEMILEEWEHKGFNTHEVKSGEPVRWLDICIVQEMFGGPTLPCDWIEVEGSVAFHKSYPRGEVVCSESV
ncbi:hypothetical protein H2508_11185 [Parahaliea sp. F7430]|uniref:Uncharacterized protein n=1 Tax=Sediminihaliea albiluteola TaxID=2758564 RepID=A0A7W2TXE1_9GAMM|nr:hypothetical protein [Sediminihaliea albiluteola]MBA6413672.1 hypothetical protein [Sediminihaliea albiluteola]